MTIVDISSSEAIGQGLHRRVYISPEDPSRCIKIMINENVPESIREERYYQLLDKRLKNWDMIPRFYGEVETNFGRGVVFDLMLDECGSVSKTLAHYFADKHITLENFSGLNQAFWALKKYILDNAILSMRMKPKNVMYRNLGNGQGRLYIVDNLGNSDFFPICNYSRFFAVKKMQRRWARFETLLLTMYPENEHLEKIISARTLAS